MICKRAELHGEVSNRQGGNWNESTSVSKTDLRKVQNHKEKRQSNGYMRESEAQAEARLISPYLAHSEPFSNLAYPMYAAVVKKFRTALKSELIRVSIEVLDINYFTLCDENHT
jgi:hypothetical protein